MRTSNKEFKAKLSEFGLSVYQFNETYGLPNSYFCDLLGLSKVMYNKKLKTDFTLKEKQIIHAEMTRIKDVFAEVEHDIVEIYGKRH